MSVFDELLAIKRFREGQAEIAVSRQRLRHAEADAAKRGSEAALVSYRDEAERHEQAMYSDLCSRVVRVREIENVLQGVAGLREGERQHEQAVETAAQQLEHESKALAASRQQHQQAVRLTGKFVELAPCSRAPAAARPRIFQAISKVSLVKLGDTHLKPIQSVLNFIELILKLQQSLSNVQHTVTLNITGSVLGLT